MNKTTAVFGVIVAVLLVGGLIYVNRSTTPISNDATASPIASGVTEQDNSGEQTPQGTLPSVKTNATAIPTDTTAVISGSVTPNGGSTRYWFEYGTTADMGSKTPEQMVGSGFTAITSPAYITGLVKDTVYYFRLDAVNQYGQVSNGQYSFTTTHGNPPPIGSIPAVKTLAASVVSSTTASLNGEVTPNKADTRYWFEYGRTSDLGSVSSFVSIGNAAIKLDANLSLSGLNPNTKYFFRLNAQNQFGTVNGSILNFKTNK